MRSDLFSEKNNAGFEIKLATDKFADITIKKMTVEEYDIEPDANPFNNEVVPARLCFNKGVKANFEECISLLSLILQEEIIKIDRFLMEEKELKIKRKIEGDKFGCKITYTSTYGFSYSLRINEHLMDHFYWWYMISNYKFENKYMGRKNDFTNETLQYVNSESPEIASRLVGYFDHCCACMGKCQTKTIYELNNKKYAVCHGKMIMNMNLQTFADLRFMLNMQKDVIKKWNGAFDF
jgi:hypothetical protein